MNADGYYCKCLPIVFDSTSKCSKCRLNYTLFGDACISNTCVKDNKQCSGHGYCSIDTHSIKYICACQIGYTGEFCDDCLAGYLKTDSGCVSPFCVDNDIECNNQGKCEETQDIWKCSCNNGRSGDKCERCYRDYQMSIDGNCIIEDCFSNNQECGGNGICSNLNMEHKCVCNAEFTSESRCIDCVQGFMLQEDICIEVVIEDVINKINGGIIAGIVIAILAAIIAICVGIWFIVKRRKQKIDANNVPKDLVYDEEPRIRSASNNNFI